MCQTLCQQRGGQEHSPETLQKTHTHSLVLRIVKVVFKSCPGGIKGPVSEGFHQDLIRSVPFVRQIRGGEEHLGRKNNISKGMKSVLTSSI